MVVTQEIRGNRSIINATSVTNEYQSMLVEIVAVTDCESATHQTDLSVSDPVLMTQIDAKMVTNFQNLNYTSSMTLVNLAKNFTLTTSSVGERLDTEEDRVRITEIYKPQSRQTPRMSTSKFSTLSLYIYIYIYFQNFTN